MLFLNLVIDKWGFYQAHKKELDIIFDKSPTFIAELAWLEINAPLVRKYILNPIFLAIGRDSVKGITAEDVAFVIGRSIYAIAKKSIAKTAGAITWDVVIAVYKSYNYSRFSSQSKASSLWS